MTNPGIWSDDSVYIVLSHVTHTAWVDHNDKWVAADSPVVLHLLVYISGEKGAKIPVGSNKPKDFLLALAEYVETRT